MDSMRAALMMLGVVLHSAQVFNPSQTWLVYSPHSSVIAGWLVECIHIFRMPAFFVISGFFCVLTLRRYKAKRFLQLRLRRLIVPIISTALTLNLLQALILQYSGWRSFNLLNYFMRGGWVSHLWFLINLVLYFLLFALVYSALGSRLKASILDLVNACLKLRISSLLVALPLLSILVLALNKFGFPLYKNYFGFINVFSLMKYFPFFAVGALLALHAKLFVKFSCCRPIVPAIGIGISSVISHNMEWFSIKLNPIIEAYAEGLLVWSAVLIVFYGFHRFCNEKSNTWLYLSESSYTVYLFHHIIVVSIGIALAQSLVSGFVGMMVLIVVTMSLTLLIQRYLVLNVKLVRFMFNGK